MSGGVSLVGIRARPQAIEACLVAPVFRPQTSALIFLSLADYIFRQGHGILRIHPSNRGTAVRGSKHLARTGYKKFTGLDKLPLLLPPRTELITHITGHAPGDGKSQFSRNFACFFLSIHTTCNNTDAEFRQDLALFFKAV